MSLPKVIVLVGPTACGKTTCGIEIAKVVGGEVLACDSRTVYRGMDIGTAKPVGIQKHGGVRAVDGVLHWGFDIVEPSEDYNVGQFKVYAGDVVSGILAREHVPVFVGGTGLWVDVVVRNLSLPDVPPDPVLRAGLEARETGDLAREYLELDPCGADFIDVHNKRRLIRAIEVCRKTHEPFSQLRQTGSQLYDALWLGMGVETDELDRRINARVDAMMESGLLGEARRLYERYGCGAPSMTGIGYRELCQFFGGSCTLAEALQAIKQHTRGLAKRQRTWWKAREEIHWVSDAAEAVTLSCLFVSPQAQLSQGS